MNINWALVIGLFFLSLPGVLIAIPRLINLFLDKSSETIKQRITKIAVAHTLFMVVIMSITGSLLSTKTDLDAPLLHALFQGQNMLPTIQENLLPIFLYTIGGLLVFFTLYYGLVSSFLDEDNLRVMHKMRAKLGLDGCILYGGIVEEILARWGLMNVMAVFLVLIIGQANLAGMVSAGLFSSVVFSLGQIPAYVAAGCQATRRFIYALVLLNVWQAILFGLIFWQYGILSAMFSHILFHLGWWIYDH